LPSSSAGFNSFITERLYQGAMDALTRAGRQSRSGGRDQGAGVVGSAVGSGIEPLVPALGARRGSIACSSLFVVNTPNATARPSQSPRAAMPLAASPAT